MTEQIIDAPALDAVPPGKSPGRRALDRFMRNRMAMGGVVVIAIIAILSFLVPALSPHDIVEVNWSHVLSPPSFSSGFWFGTDVNGRDLMVRTFYAGRISLAIGLLATAIAFVIGVVYGSISGFFGGRVDAVMMRICDVIYALPTLFFIVILVTVFRAKNIFFVFMCIGAVEWLTMARIVRGQTLSVKRKEYVESAWAIGLPRSKILTRYIIPNVTGAVIVYVTLLIPVNILIESYLSFLGLGVQEPLTSWGLLIAQGSTELAGAPWLLIFPAFFLTVTLFAFNFIGDGLRDALDPRDR
ncbi:ABC transporter permease [Brevundimonas faecalis]|uniref:ABC transporter permease n=1 Tax=Brevundimonas faecalis TaxID=947378 RepID=UPI003612666E